jgi:hypothetical protein
METIKENIDNLLYLDHKPPNLNKLLDILMDPQHDINEKRTLIWAYLNLDETVLYENEEAKDMLEHLWKCLGSNSQC